MKWIEKVKKLTDGSLDVGLSSFVRSPYLLHFFTPSLFHFFTDHCLVVEAGGVAGGFHAGLGFEPG
jgi:hypothetical protein